MTDVLEPVRPAPDVAEDPACPARRHHTDTAWRRHGCRCPQAVAAHDRRLARQRESLAARRPRIRAQDLARRRRQGHDSRGYWRGPHARVDRVNLMLLCSGFIDPATTARERMVAALRLSRTGNRAGTGLLEVAEIAERIGCGEKMVRFYLKGMPTRLRDSRTKRRLADAKWRAWRKHGQVW